MTDDAETIRALTERKVYVVIDDDGESINVTGVFSKAEDAEAMKAITPYSYVAKIVLDEFSAVSKAGLPLWRVEQMRGCLHLDRAVPSRESWAVAWGVRELIETYSGEFHHGLVVYVWAKDEESATAKAAEMFCEHAAAKEPTDAD